MSAKPYLSVIVPSYNEMKNLKRGALDELISYLEKQDYTWEVILSDDGSTDGTPEALKKFATKHASVRAILNPHAGKGPTVQSGMLEATGIWRLFTDFDQSTPLQEIEKLWPFTKDGFDIVIGSREISGARRGEEPWYRHIMGRGFNFLVQTLAVPGIHDTQCGFKLFSGVATEKLFSALEVYGRSEERSDPFTGAFDVEVLFLARKHDFSIKEVPIHWNHYETDRVSPIKDSILMLIDIIKIRITAMQGKYSS